MGVEWGGHWGRGWSLALGLYCEVYCGSTVTHVAVEGGIDPRQRTQRVLVHRVGVERVHALILRAMARRGVVLDAVVLQLP